MVLNKEQIERLYMVFDFSNDEEIVCAELEDHQLKIHYVDNSNGVNGTYEPYFAKHSEEDINKLKFILYGWALK